MKLDDDGFEVVEVKVNKLNRLYRIAAGVGRQGGIAEQAFTKYYCLRCEQEKMHHNTNTPRICSECYFELKEDFNE